VRVLLVRLDGIGDAAVCAPLLLALRDAGHDVGAALTTRNAGLFAPGVFLAEHVLERIPWPAHGSTPASSAAARASIAAERYDVALIASEEPEAYALAAPIPQRAGFTTGWHRPLKSLWVATRVTRRVGRAQRAGGAGSHEAEVLFRLGRGLATGPPSADPERLRPLFARSSGVPARSGVVLQAGSKWGSIGIDAAALRAVAEALEGGGLRVLAAPAEAEAAAAALGRPVESFGDLGAWVAALDGAAAVVTPDTGAAHVAGMLGVPVVDVFPDAGFAAQVRRWSPWAAPFVALRASELAGAPAAAIEAALDGLRRRT
jgi:ADP-heptose:LPS heptosyltransferase